VACDWSPGSVSATVSAHPIDCQAVAEPPLPWTLYAEFHWQRGYGAFSVSQSGVAEVVNYIEGQKEHHQRRTFQEDYREFLKRYEVPYNERYVWV